MSDRRGKYFAIPRELWRDAVRLLSPGQRLALVALIAEANYTAGTVTLPDGSQVAIDRGEVLVGGRTFADRHGLGRFVVRATLARLKALGWADTHQACSPPLSPPPPRGTAQGDSPPPTVVHFNVHREILWPEPEASPPPRPTPQPTPPARDSPIQHDLSNTDTEGSAADAAPPPLQPDVGGRPAAPAASPSKRRREPDPRHQPLVEGLVADFQTARHVAYGFAGAKDAAAVKALLALGTAAVGSEGAVDEVRRRWKIALGLGARWPGCSSIAMLPARWNELATAPPKLGPDGRPLKRYPKVQVHTEYS